MKVYEISVCLLIIFASAFADDPKLFVLNGTDGIPCFLEEFDATFSVSYKTKSGQKTGMVTFPQDATINKTSSSCSSQKAVLTLIWGELDVNYFTQVFEVKKDLFVLSSVELGMSLADPELFPDSTEDATTLQIPKVPQHFVTAETKYSYECMAEQTVDYGGLSVTFKNMRVQPFNVHGTTFGDAEICEADLSSSPATDMTTMMMTTTHIKPHTTAQPKPEPKNALFNLTVHGKSCLLDTFNASISYNYTIKGKQANHTTDIKYAVLDKGNSFCRNKHGVAQLAIKFDEQHMSSMVQTFSLIKVDDDSTDFYLSKLTVSVKPPKDSKVVKFDFEMGNSTFRAPNDTAYRCNSKDKLMGKAAVNLQLDITFRDVKLQPFNIINSTWSSESVCSNDQAISNVVPIAVGCALAALVVIVLIAYLIGRRNSSRSGYESV